jgi:hypothetical protein
VDVVRAPAAEDGVVLVLAALGVALLPALLAAVVVFEAEVPAARSLAEVAADGAEVSDLRGRDGGRRLGKAGELGANLGMFFDL